MKQWSGLVFGVILVLTIAALPVAAADDPATVVRQFFDARNRYDIEAVVALVTDDLHFIGGPNCTPAKPCLGPQRLRAEIRDSYIPDHAQVIILGTPQVSGTTVTFRSEDRADAFRRAGVERVITTVTIEVRDGKIASHTGVFDVSDPQTAQFLAAQRAAHSPPMTPTPPTAPRTGGGDGAALIRRLGDG